jgi:hypothetical protein
MSKDILSVESFCDSNKIDNDDFEEMTGGRRRRRLYIKKLFGTEFETWFKLGADVLLQINK